MARTLIKAICIIGCWACMISAALIWGLKAGAVVAVALILEAIHATIFAIEIEEEYELGMEEER